MWRNIGDNILDIVDIDTNPESNRCGGQKISNGRIVCAKKPRHDID